MRLRAVFGLGLLLLAVTLRAQEPLPQGLTTLRVYANLIQLPTMVLDRWGDPVKARPGQKFMVSIDKGKPFLATHVRPQGEDAITLAILIDASNPQNELLPYLPEALSKLAPLRLEPRDHVSLFAIDCGVVRTLTDKPANADTLKTATDLALNAPNLHGPKPGKNCHETRRLWDTLAYMIDQMKDLPGRRVILVLSEGQDTASKRTWQDVRDDAQHHGVAIFGMAPSYDTISPGGRMAPMTHHGAFDANFDTMCQLSGGRVFLAERSSLVNRLRDFITLLRDRFIVQFPRSKTMSSGSHDVAITVAGQQYLIRPAGISVPLAGPDELAPQPLQVAEPDPPTTPPPDPQ